MSRTELTAQAATRAGLAPSFAAANADGHMFANNGHRVLRIKNTNGAAVTVTVLIPGEVDGQAVPGKTITVPATTGDVITDVWPAVYNQADGRVWLDYSAVTGVTVALVEFSGK